MTPEHIELHRKRFEELELLNGFGSHRHYRDESRYWNEHQQSRWEGYLMHAENQEVELPDSNNFPRHSDAYDMHGAGEAAYREAIDDCRDLLMAQGIKVKD